MHLALVGPTGVGKSAVAVALARALSPGVELVSADSMQVYRGMDIGTATPGPAERAEVPHHLLDVVEPTEEFSVAAYQALAGTALAGIADRGRRAVLVGGTGLYVQAVVDGLSKPGRYPEVRQGLESDPDTPALHRRLSTLDPVAAARILPGNRRRVVRALEVTVGSGRPFSTFGPGLGTYPRTSFHLAGLRVPRPVLDQRIERRLHDMVEAGLVEEVRRLLSDHPAGLSRTAGQALGYREVIRHVAEGVPLDDCLAEAVRRTRRFARRQEAWFGRDPRIVWYRVGDDPASVVPDVLGDWEGRCRASH